MANNCCVKKDWAELSTDLLPLIAKKLQDLIDFIRFRAVCKQWRSAISCSAYPCKTPWLMTAKEGINNEIHIRMFPSGKSISIPSLADHRHNDFMLSLRLFNCDTSGHDFVTPAPVVNLSEIFSLQPSGMKRKHILNFPCRRSVAPYMGKIFQFLPSSFLVARIKVIDGPTGNEISTIPAPVNFLKETFLISTRDGLLLIMERHVESENDDEPCFYKHHFVVYRLENYHKKPYWIKLTGIGDMMLFLDDYNCFSLMASECGEFMGNCIYFITPLKQRGYPSLPTHVVAGFDMTAKRTFIVCSLGKYIRLTKYFWFMPSLA